MTNYISTPAEFFKTQRDRYIRISELCAECKDTAFIICDTMPFCGCWRLDNKHEWCGCVGPNKEKYRFYARIGDFSGTAAQFGIIDMEDSSPNIYTLDSYLEYLKKYGKQ